MTDSPDELLRPGVAGSPSQPGDLVFDGRDERHHVDRRPSRPTPTWSPSSTAPPSADRRAACARAGPTTRSSARRAPMPPGTSGVRWLIDPIDGTTNFLYDLPGYAVSIAALGDDGTLVGAVYVPGDRRAVHGDRRRRARRSTAARSAAARRPTLAARPGRHRVQLPRRAAPRPGASGVAQIIPRIRDIRRFGAAAIDLCYVAAGRLDVYYEQWLGPVGLAAGELIAREAGCRTGRFDGGPMRPSQCSWRPGLFDQSGAVRPDGRVAGGHRTGPQPWHHVSRGYSHPVRRRRRAHPHGGQAGPRGRGLDRRRGRQRRGGHRAVPPRRCPTSC